jgi:leucyl aminopeptidase
MSAKTKFITERATPDSVTTKLLVVGAFKGEFPAGDTLALNAACNGVIAGQGAEEEFTGAKGQTLVCYTNNLIGARRVLVYGLGARDKFNLEVLREALTSAFKRARGLKIDELVVGAFDLEGTGVSAEQFGETVATYVGLVTYQLNHFKTAKGGHKPETTLRQLRVLAGNNDAAGIRRGVATGTVIAAAQNNARDLVNLPPNMLNPTTFAARARELGRKTKGAVKCTVLGKRECQRLGMNAFLAVNQGSDVPPQFVILEYTPEGAAPDVVLGLVGKTITFDSGGLDLKSADGMSTMKCDMAGGATVLSAMGAIAALKLPVKVIAVMAATENMPSGKAYRPSDVITTMSGRTIEINNTDAEGRVTLADAVHYIRQLGATHVIDLATLTGAMLGTTAHVGAGLFGNNDEFNAKVLAAAKSVGEYLWPMPMWPELKKGNDTPMADLSNTGAKLGGAGSSTAALFIGEFAEDTPWVHLDIAGTAYRKVEFQADPVGGTGWGLRTLVALAKAMAAK